MGSYHSLVAEALRVPVRGGRHLLTFASTLSQCIHPAARLERHALLQHKLLDLALLKGQLIKEVEPPSQATMLQTRTCSALVV